MDANDITAVIWAKTDAGRSEIQARSVVKERAQRNLLLLIDGAKSTELLLSSLAGISQQDFRELAHLGLIAPAGSAAPAELPGAAPAAPAGASPAPASVAPIEPLDYAEFTAVLTRLISQELGLRGFMLTLAVEKASTIADLRSVAQRALEQIRARRGDAAADAATRTLFGG